MSKLLDKLLQGQEDNHILPFFWQHGEDEATLRKYMNVIHDANIGAVCLESRPHPDFCGPKWWQDLDVILDEAKKLNMKVWILDDSHCPTGPANGTIKTAENALRRQSLVVQYVPVADKTAVLNMADYRNAAPFQTNPANPIEAMAMQYMEIPTFDDDELVGVVAMKEGAADEAACLLDLTHTEHDGKIVFEAPDDGVWKIAVLHLTRNRGPHRDFMNMMDMASCHKLIEAVYEQHYARYADEFGKTIAGFFSDEPEIGNGHLFEFGKRIGENDDQAWSTSVGERLKVKWGDNFVKYLPLIWNQSADRDLQAQIRCDYMDAVTLEVQQSFSMQVGNWCREHSVKYIGHLIEDEHQHSRTGSSLGHYFRGLSGQDWAGLDVIRSQVMPQKVEIGPGDFVHSEYDGEFWQYALGKLGGSMAAIDPLKHGNCVCEIFGAYGWSEGVRLEKYLADHFMVRGVNQFVPHAFSPAPFPDPDCPPHFYAHGHNPQYRHFGALMKYMNRVSTLLSGGKPIVPVAILYDAEADWTGDHIHMQKPAIRLYDHQIDYHYIPSDVFLNATEDPSLRGLTVYDTTVGKTLKIGQQEYSVFVIPMTQYVRRSVAQAAVKMAENGGKVVFIDALPEATIEGGRSDAAIQKLAELVGNGTIIRCSVDELVPKLIGSGIADAVISPAAPMIRIYHYQHEKDLYYIVNEAAETYTGEIRIYGAHSAVWYDAWHNSVTNARMSDRFAFTLDPSKSLILVLDETAEDKPTITGEVTALELDKGWMRSICKSIDYPAFADTKQIDFPDTLALEKPKFSGYVRYEKTINLETLPASAVLTISDAYEGVEVFVNGKSCGIQVVPEYRFELVPYLEKGDNQLRIEVATTLEREATEFANMLSAFGVEQKEVTVPSGINGSVKLEICSQDKG